MKRREFLEGLASASALAALSSGLAKPAIAATQYKSRYTDRNLRWDKAVCRFCGTGCGVMVGVRRNKVVATKGDAKNPVNRGMTCIKGYFLSHILYGKDRLTSPLLRMKNGQYDKNGEFEPVSWDKALDLMAEKFIEAIQKKGPTSVGMFGSGQWTIFEGYAAVKLMKAGFLSNNIDPNARHCMASAVAAFVRTFGADEPMGNYKDFEEGENFVLWGSNMAEMHPILWSRIAHTRMSKPNSSVHVLSTYRHRCFDLSDNDIIFKPQSDLVIANYIANYIIKSDKVNSDFISNHTTFKKVTTDIGYGLRPTHLLEKKAKNPGNGAMHDIDFEEYKKHVSTYTLEKTAAFTGVPEKRLQKLAELYADPTKKVVSLWTMGVNQHVRGTWMNHLIYNLHLLTGKISMPGNNPFSLTGQPSACGTAREVGTFAHRLPADLVVANPAHRAVAEKIWKLPKGAVNPKVGYHAVLQSRMLKDGKLNVYWSMCNNNMQAAPNMDKETYPGWRNPEAFVIVSDPYPTVSAMAADLILPTAMWVEKEGAYGNAERRTQFWYQQVAPNKNVKSDLWQIISLAKRIPVAKIWSKELLAQKPAYQDKTLYDILFANGQVNKYPLSKASKHAGNHEAEAFGYYVQKGLFEEYRRFQQEGPKTGHEQAPFDEYMKVRGLVWPYINGKEVFWRYRENYDPMVKEGQNLAFYGNPDKKARIVFAPYEPAAEEPNAEYPIWLTTGRVLEHWHTGSMTQRVPELFQAMPRAVLYLNINDALKYKLHRGEAVRISSRRGSIQAVVETHGRNKMPQGVAMMPFFDAKHLVNKLVLDATDPISKETDFKKVAIKIEKIN